MASQPHRVSSLPIPLCQTVRRALLSAVRSVPHIIRVHCSLVVCSLSITQVQEPTSLTMSYKMGPMHWGILERGTKTASGSYLLMPATIGTFSVCFGKLMHHPNTTALPFSYLIAEADKMYLVPGRNITTVGLYRDIRKWPKRDMRPQQTQKSIVNFDWLSPYSVGEILQGKKILENLRQASGDNVSSYNYHEYVINATSLRKGIKIL